MPERESHENERLVAIPGGFVSFINIGALKFPFENILTMWFKCVLVSVDACFVVWVICRHNYFATIFEHVEMMRSCVMGKAHHIFL
jgi:hypothetical protein